LLLGCGAERGILMARAGRATLHYQTAPLTGRIGSHIAANAIQGLSGNAPAIAQTRDQLAIIDGSAAKGGFGQTHLPTILADLQQ
jgi:hypothetical protein